MWYWSFIIYITAFKVSSILVGLQWIMGPLSLLYCVWSEVTWHIAWYLLIEVWNLTSSNFYSKFGVFQHWGFRCDCPCFDAMLSCKWIVPTLFRLNIGQWKLLSLIGQLLSWQSYTILLGVKVIGVLYNKKLIIRPTIVACLLFVFVVIL